MSGAVLALEDGRTFSGRAVGAPGTTFGEVVFNTGMSGYQETLTDPSYRGQIVVMTAAHIGNYGLNDEDVESSRIQVAGFAARHFPDRFSSARGKEPIGQGLLEGGVVGIDELDARALVRHLRSRGVMRGAISTETASEADVTALVEKVKEQPTMAGAALALTVGTTARYGFALPPEVARKGRVAAIDYGIKRNILRMLAARGLEPDGVPGGGDRRGAACRRIRRLLPFERAGRSRRAAVVRRGGEAPRRVRNARVRHLPRAAAPGPRARRHDLQAQVRPPRREPSR